MRPRSLAAALAVVFVAITALSVAAGLSSALGPAAAAAAAAQPAAAPTTGPIIADFGPAYAVPDPGWRRRCCRSSRSGSTSTRRPTTPRP
ncbi:MAG: hypothetical protein R2708_21460 [Vicinamibacterales bacterium]